MKNKEVSFDWPADKVERWAVDRLVPYARNARKHSEEQVEQIAESLKRYGWTMPVLAGEDGSIIAGHGRVLAAKVLGYEEVPVMTARGWSEEQRRSYAIADNKLALNSAWDLELLAAELQTLDVEHDIRVLGFSDGELADLFGTGAAGDGATDATYTSKFDAPHYEPSGNTPELAELVNGAKASELADQIRSASVSDAEKSFLLRATERHTVFDFRKIADYYASASPEMQDLMERSALVIIDFGKAIENGYVTVNKRITAQYAQDVDDDDHDD